MKDSSSICDRISADYFLPIRADAAVQLGIMGRYECSYVDANGCETWHESVPNTVMVDARTFMLETLLSGVAYTVTGPFMGLISSVGFDTITADDNMSDHAWAEAGGATLPTYSGTRPAITWNAAADATKNMNSPVLFDLTSYGEIAGLFVCFGPGATNSVDSTGGLLYSAGLFPRSAISVSPGGVLRVTYSTSLLAINP